jgi:glutamate:GABA antiporter
LDQFALGAAHRDAILAGITVMNETSSPAHEQVTSHPQLKRVLGRRDLVLLFVVAVFNLNVVPSIAANGGITLWLWLVSLALFFWPQGVAVIELSHRYPGEGGVYLWAKKEFGDFHGFLSGWCYWTTNMLYIPTVLLYFVGVSVFVLGPSHQGLADSKVFALAISLVLLTVLVVLNVVGLGVGKWLNNIGGIGTGIAAGTLLILGGMLWAKTGTTITAADFRIPPDARFVLNSFGVICFALVGLELASVMGEEIRDPQQSLPGAVAWGGVICGVLYIAATLTLLIAVGRDQINVLQGIMQAASHMAREAGIGWIVPGFAVMLSLSIAGIGSAWLGGAARIPFVAGLDAYLPGWLGKLHPRYATPYAAILVHAGVSLLLLMMNFAGAGVQEAFQTMLSLAVVVQLVPFVYMFGALVKVAFRYERAQSRYRRPVLLLAGFGGMITAVFGMVLVFFPTRQIKSLLWYELNMVGGTIAFIGLAAFFFFVYSRRKARHPAVPSGQGLDR